MILFCHILLGAAIGQEISNPWLAVPLALLSHYVLDVVPHIEYPIKNIEQKNWKKSLPDFIKVFFDISLAFLLIFLFSNNHPVVYMCAFAAALPDALTLLSMLFPNNILRLHDAWHHKIHFLKHKKISTEWRIFSQVAIAIFSITIFLI